MSTSCLCAWSIMVSLWAWCTDFRWLAKMVMFSLSFVVFSSVVGSFSVVCFMSLVSVLSVVLNVCQNFLLCFGFIRAISLCILLSFSCEFLHYFFPYGV